MTTIQSGKFINSYNTQWYDMGEIMDMVETLDDVKCFFHDHYEVAYECYTTRWEREANEQAIADQLAGFEPITVLAELPF